MPRYEDLTGMQFTRLTVLEPVRRKGKLMWRCLCSCGKEVITTKSSLKSGESKSCGCYSREICQKSITKHGKHGTRIYRIWKAMKQRCNNQNCNAYHNYGERGISICKEWEDFLTFESWALSNGYADDLSIDRIDVNGNYCPENCRWATAIEQGNNKRKNRLITYNGETKTLAEWARDKNMKVITLFNRLNRGASIEDALTKDIRKARRDITFNGKTMCIEQWAKELGVCGHTISDRLEKGWTIEETLTIPKGKARRKKNFTKEQNFSK